MRWIIPAVALLIATASCGGSEADAAAKGSETIPPAIGALEIKNVAISETEDGKRVMSAGQLTQAQMAKLAELGYDTFICLRDSSEDGTGWEEDYAQDADINFDRIPVDGAAGLTKENAVKLGKAMETAEDGVVVYCGSSNRVGALLAVKAHVVDGKLEDDALKFGKQHGLKALEEETRKVLGLEGDK